MIAWKYIDKTTATIAAIRDYNNMAAIIGYTSDAVKDIHERMTAPRTAHISETPTAHSPRSGEDKLVAQIDTINMLGERYNTATEYMTWFMPAWETLTEQERSILEEYYVAGSLRDGTRGRLANELNYSERHIDRLRGEALRRLTLLLFG